VTIHIWEIRASGDDVTFARGQLVAATRVLGHSLPESIDIEVRELDGPTVATAKDLRGKEATPMAELEINDDAIRRKQMWPSDDDLGTPVILPGGEVGILTAWWHAPDHSEWRWTIELHNHA
jgi:hypothetical protein